MKDRGGEWSEEMKDRYLVIFANGRRAEFEVPTFPEFVRLLEVEVCRNGPFDLIYCVGGRPMVPVRLPDREQV